MHGATARLAMSEVNSEDPHHFYEFFFQIEPAFQYGITHGRKACKMSRYIIGNYNYCFV